MTVVHSGTHAPHDTRRFTLATSPSPVPRPRVRRDWTCLASALVILLMICAIFAFGYWVATFRLHYM
jgi:hypothetical protein